MSGTAPLIISRTLSLPEAHVVTSSFNILEKFNFRGVLGRITEIFKVKEDEIWGIYRLIIERAVRKILIVKPEDMVEAFNEGYPAFVLYITSLLSSFSIPRLYALHLEKTFKLLDEIVELEKKFYELYLKSLKEKCARVNIPIEDMEYAIAQLFDYDLWLTEKVKEHGIEKFPIILMKRAHEEASSMYNFLLALLYVVTAINAALFEIVPYNRENLRILINWAKYYASELDAYIDTVSLLVTDEYYEAIEEYLKEKRECKSAKS